MPRALAPAVRRTIVNRTCHQQSAGEIAQELNVEERSVRRIVKGYQERGESALQASYAACGVSRTAEFARLREEVLELRLQHPRWGAGRLLLELESGHPDTVELPTERTLQRWLREVYPTPAPAGRPVQEDLSRACHPHEVWQVDAAEQKRLKSGKMFSWLRVVDECSGAVLKTVVFSRRTFSTGSTPPGPARISQDFPALGLPRHDPCGQRRALGFVQRPASAIGLVDHRAGGGHALECSRSTSTKRSRGTQSRTRCLLGRAETTSDGTGVPRAHRRRGPCATRTVSRDPGADTMGRLPSVEIGRSGLQLSLGADALGLGPSLSAPEFVLCSPACRLLGQNRPLRQSVVCGNDSQRIDGLCPVQPGPSHMAHHRCARPSVARDPRTIDSTCCSNSDRADSLQVT